MARRIPLTQGRHVLVDDADYEWLSQWRWQFRRWSTTGVEGYAKRSVHLGVENGHKLRTDIVMHRLIIGAPKGAQVDHINGNTLDNRRANLRLATTAQNAHNQRKQGFYGQQLTSSKYKGVNITYTKGTHKPRWAARICVNRKRIYLGWFLNEEEAARAYDRAAAKHYGEYARLNFPDDWLVERDAEPSVLRRQAKLKEDE